MLNALPIDIRINSLELLQEDRDLVAVGSANSVELEVLRHYGSNNVPSRVRNAFKYAS